MKISGVYKITNIITGDFYVGSSKDVKLRWLQHKRLSSWKKQSNNQLYLDMQKYGVDKFEFQILEEADPEQLKETEQELIEMLHPTYNDRRAKGWDIERQKDSNKKYRQSDKYKEYQKEYHQSDKYKEYHKEYNKSDKNKNRQNKYQNQLCFYNGEILTLNTLSARFFRAGVPHPVLEAKKYLLK